MKVTSHIPVEQYGFVEIEHNDCSPENVRKEYGEYADAFKAGDGLEAKEWNATVDACLKNELKLSPDTWERMSQNQQWFLQEIKKSKNRK